MKRPKMGTRPSSSLVRDELGWALERLKELGSDPPLPRDALEVADLKLQVHHLRNSGVYSSRRAMPALIRIRMWRTSPLATAYLVIYEMKDIREFNQSCLTPAGSPRHLQPSTPPSPSPSSSSSQSSCDSSLEDRTSE